MLERLDLISTRSIQPSLEYIFKHALTQEIVYNGLIKSERKLIHKKIGDVIELLFKDRLSEFYETLAYHYVNGEAKLKAIKYQSKSGQKCLKRYSLDESQQYFSKAYDLILKIDSELKEKDEVLISTLIKWAQVLYYRGEFNIFLDLVDRHLEMAESIKNKSLMGMFYGWIGFSIHSGYAGKADSAYETLVKALDISKNCGDKLVLAYCYTWLIWICRELGRYDEAEYYGNEALLLSERIANDHYLFFKIRSGLADLYLHRGNIQKAVEFSEKIIEYGHNNSIVRSVVMGYCYKAFAQYARGDYTKSIEILLKGIRASRDTYYTLFLKFYLGISYVKTGNYREAIIALNEVCEHGKSGGRRIMTYAAYAEIFYGAALVAEGAMQKGIDKIFSIKEICKSGGANYLSLVADYVLGSIYAQIVIGENALGAKVIFKNIGFLFHNVPSAMKKAESYLLKTIKEGNKIGSGLLVGEACYDLGLAYKAKKKNDRALKYLNEAKEAYQKMGADINLNKAKDAMATLT